MKISIVVAVSNNGVIGSENKLLWHLPADLKFFKNLTLGHCIVMGRKTYESIGRPLPNRTNIIISQNQGFKAEGCLVFSTLESAILEAKKIEQNDKIFIIGGGNVYKQALAIADELYVTEVNINVNGDTFFPKIDEESWQLINEENHEADEKNTLDYSFKKYIKY